MERLDVELAKSRARVARGRPSPAATLLAVRHCATGTSRRGDWRWLAPAPAQDKAHRRPARRLPPRRRPPTPAERIDTLKRIRDTGAILIGVREAVGAVLVPRRAEAAAGLLGRPVPARRRGDQGRAQAAAPRRQVRPGELGQPHPGAGREARSTSSAARRPTRATARSRSRSRTRRSSPASRCWPRQVVEHRRHRGPARQDRRGDQGHDQREDAAADERRAGAQADASSKPKDHDESFQRGRGRQGGGVPDGRRAALRPHLEGDEAATTSPSSASTCRSSPTRS